MGAYKEYLNYLDNLGLQNISSFDYKNKDLNQSLETERLLNRSCMMFEWHGLPSTIPALQLEKVLQTQGYAIIGKINGELYALYGGLGGRLDEYYRPTEAIVSVPYLNFNATWKIGEDCVVIKNDLMYQGMLPLYSKYVSLMNETEITLVMALVNTRVQTIFSASDDKTIKSAKMFVDKLFQGELSVIEDNKMLESLTIHDKAVKSADLAEIRETLQYLRGQLYNEMGLATNYNLKKERITQAEVELNTDNLYPLPDNMLFRRREGIDEVKEMFGEEWSVEFNSVWDYRVLNGEPMTTLPNGDISTEEILDKSGDVSDNIDAKSLFNDFEPTLEPVNENLVPSDNGESSESDSASGQGTDEESYSNQPAEEEVPVDAYESSTAGTSEGGNDESADRDDEPQAETANEEQSEANDEPMNEEAAEDIVEEEDKEDDNN